MARFHTDHNVERYLAEALRQAGHDVTIARDVGLARASDAEHLLYAFHQDRTIITHNRKDFYGLQCAWLLWPPGWDIPAPKHHGILVLDHKPSIDVVDEILGRTVPFANQLYDWSRGHAWRQFHHENPKRLLPLP